jgi:hypothetical protein
MTEPVLFEAFGQRLSLRQWAWETGLNEHTIRIRIKRGWSIEDALGRPLIENVSALSNDTWCHIKAAVAAGESRGYLANRHHIGYQRIYIRTRDTAAILYH